MLLTTERNDCNPALQVQADVETQGDFVRTLVAEVRDATFATIEDVVAFVAWLDQELSFLVSIDRLVPSIGSMSTID
jgi:mannitol-1-phosphate/altronate dehydrogenase